MTYLDNPELVFSKLAKSHGYCDICDIYSATFYGLCRDCYVEQNMTDWKLNQEISLNLIKKARLEEAWKNEVNKRHKRGLAPINLRN